MGSSEDSEDAMYANMSEEEKINAIRLNDEKFEQLMKIFVDFETMMASLSDGQSCAGYVISKQIALNPMKKINVFVKKKRRKKKVASINLHEDEEEENENEDANEENEEEEKKKEEEIQ